MLIPAQNVEMERIYQNICSSQMRSITFTSASASEGVTSIAQSLTQRLLLAGHSVVFIDLNLYKPNVFTLLNYTESRSDACLLASPNLVSIKGSDAPFIGITAPQERASILQLRKPGVLEKCIEELRSTFDYVICDTTPVNRINSQNIPADRVAAACDACYLVVKSGSTNQSMVQAATNRLIAANVNLIGCIFNDMHNPSLRAELLRECNRLKSTLPSVAEWLIHKISINHFLSIDE